MSCKRMIRKPEVMRVTWPGQVRVEPWTEDKSKAVGGFLHRVGAKLSSECRDGTLASAVYYSLRAFAYQKAHETPYLQAAQQASSLVFDAKTNELIAVCLLCGGDDLCGLYHLEVDPKCQRRGIGRAMMRKALATLAEAKVPLMDLWACDGSPGIPLYEELGFVFTGEED